MKKYQYPPLPANNHTRVCTIYPGRFNDDLIISFDTVTLQADGSFNFEALSFRADGLAGFEALSYTWDKNKSSQPIFVEEQDGPIIVVMQSLTNALLHLRYPNKPRLMWVDELCIDQSNDVEKSIQVAMMGSIYRAATSVIAWLGPEKDSSNRAINTLSWIGSQVSVDYSRWIVNPSEECTDDSFRNMDANIPLRPEDTEAIYHLVSRRWFERLWIRQEVLVYESRAMVQCGFYTIAWSSLRKALLCLYMKRRPRYPFEDRLYDRLISLRGLVGQPSTVPLGFIRVVFGQSKCTDHRDRVYALLEFLPESDRAIVGMPDYTKDTVEVFKGIMWRWIVHYRSLNLLSQCEPGNDHPGSAPSWIPDWSEKEVIFGRNYWRTFASSQFAASCTLSSEGKTLRTLGISSTTVTYLQPIPIMRDRHVEEVENCLRNLLPDDLLNGDYPTGISKLEAYARTFLANAVAEMAEPWRGEDPTLEDAKSIVIQLYETRKASASQTRAMGPSDAFFKISRAMVGGKQLMTTSHGYIGIAPCLAEPGDEICILVGCHTPMILRPLGEGRFRIVGEAYVLGLSEGEALLGPLPKNIRRVFASNDEWGVHSYFENSVTSEKTFEDPRIPLSIDQGRFRALLQKDPNSKIELEPEVLKEHFPQLSQIEIV